MLYADLNAAVGRLREAIMGRNHLTIRATMIGIRELRQRIALMELKAANKNN